MTTYQEIDDAEIASGAPGKNSVFTRLRDNVLAIIQGDATAPKISTAALATVPGQNTAIYNAAGTFSLTVPAGITSMEFDVTGSGGRVSFDALTRLGGAGERRLARIAVTPGETLTLVVAAAAAAPYGSGGSSSFVKRGASVLIEAKGGVGGPAGTGGTGGTGGAGFTGSSGVAYDASQSVFVIFPQPAAPHGGCSASNGASVVSDNIPGLVIVRY